MPAPPDVTLFLASKSSTVFRLYGLFPDKVASRLSPARSVGAGRRAPGRSGSSRLRDKRLVAPRPLAPIGRATGYGWPRDRTTGGPSSNASDGRLPSKVVGNLVSFERLSDVMGVDMLPFLTIDFSEPHVTGPIEVGNPEAEWQHRSKSNRRKSWRGCDGKVPCGFADGCAKACWALESVWLW